MNGWSEGLNSIIRCVKIREMGSSVTPIEKDRNLSLLTYDMWITVVRLGRSSERIQLKVRLAGETMDVVLQSRN